MFHGKDSSGERETGEAERVPDGAVSANGERKAGIFRLAKVPKRFGGVVAVREVDFDLLEGEIHALVGENDARRRARATSSTLTVA